MKRLLPQSIAVLLTVSLLLDSAGASALTSAATYKNQSTASSAIMPTQALSSVGLWMRRTAGMLRYTPLKSTRAGVLAASVQRFMNEHSWAREWVYRTGAKYLYEYATKGVASILGRRGASAIATRDAGSVFHPEFDPSRHTTPFDRFRDRIIAR